MDKLLKNLMRKLNYKGSFPGSSTMQVTRNRAINLSLKWAILLTCGITAAATYYSMYSSPDKKYRLCWTRMMSRTAGHLMGVPIPRFLRQPLYNTFCKVYKVNTDEIKLPITEFKTFKEFFTRHLKDGSRPLSDPNNNSILCAPADSTMLAFGEVADDKIHCVKGHVYSVGDLIYGPKYATADPKKLFPSLAKNPDHRLYYAVFYLSPSDYHRYHSPTSLILKERCHVIGYLNPVMPSYLLTHKLGLKDNERVSVLGQWEQGEMVVTFVGALNVGSMSLHFDPDLKTNMPNPYRSDYGLRKDYLAGIKETSMAADDLNLASNTTLDQLVKVWSLYKKEFELNDMVDQNVQNGRRAQKEKKLQEIEQEAKIRVASLKNVHYFYNPKDEVSLEHNIYNNFKSTLERVKQREEKYEHKDKAKEAANFTETTEGIFVKKGAEMGMFNFGSTVVIVFSAPKNLEFRCKIGEKVKVGQAVFPLIKTPQ